MKKITIAILVGTFCLGTTNTFAQTKQETPQEKIMRLEIENKVRQELMDSLSRKVATLEAELNKQQVATQKAAPAKKNTATALKPYYATLEIQQKCEQYKECAKWAKDIYELSKSHGSPFKITSTKENRYTQESGIFHRTVKTVYKLVLYINGADESTWTDRATLIRVGLGTNPLSWEEKMDAAWYNRQMYRPTLH